jgi:hypothetical protein
MLRFVHADLLMVACWSVCVCLLMLQAALMSAVPSAMTALDGYRGVVMVAQNGLGFLQNLSVDARNKVCFMCLGAWSGLEIAFAVVVGVPAMCAYAHQRGVW